MTDDFDIEFIHITLLQFDVDIRILDILFALLQTVRSEVFQQMCIRDRLLKEFDQKPTMLTPDDPLFQLED